MPKETIEALTAKEMASAAQVFADLAALLERASHDLDATKEDQLFVFRAESLRRALDRATAFQPELYRSLLALNSGNPLDSQSRKNTKRKRP